MPSPGTDVVPSKVFDAVLELAKSGSDERAFSNSTHTGLEIETSQFGLITVALRHSSGGVPEKFIAVGASITQLDNVPMGEMSPDGVVVSDVVSYREGGTADGKIGSASLKEVLAAVSRELR